MALSTIQSMRRAADFLNQGNEQQCASTLQALLLRPNIPLFWRIHALALLSHAVEDWFEAKVRMFQVQGQNNSDHGAEIPETSRSSLAVQS
jgi:hypothetical protein